MKITKCRECTFCALCSVPITSAFFKILGQSILPITNYEVTLIPNLPNPPNLPNCLDGLICPGTKSRSHENVPSVLRAHHQRFYQDIRQSIQPITNYEATLIPNPPNLPNLPNCFNALISAAATSRSIEIVPSVLHALCLLLRCSSPERKERLIRDALCSVPRAHHQRLYQDIRQSIQSITNYEATLIPNPPNLPNCFDALICAGATSRSLGISS